MPLSVSALHFTTTTVPGASPASALSMRARPRAARAATDELGASGHEKAARGGLGDALLPPISRDRSHQPLQAVTGNSIPGAHAYRPGGRVKGREVTQDA